MVLEKCLSLFLFCVFSFFFSFYVFLNCLVWSSVFLTKLSFSHVTYAFLYVLWLLYICSKNFSENDNLSYFLFSPVHNLFLTFFFELSTFSTQTLSEKLHVLCLSVSSYFVFLTSVFHVVFYLIFLDLLRNMLPFYRVFFTSLFPPFVHHLSICSFFCLLLFSRFFHLFSLFKLPFFVFSVSLCFYMSNSLWKNFLNFCETIFLLFTSKKNFVFSVYFSLGLFFPCLVFFCVVKNGFSFYNPSFFWFFFSTLFLFFSFFDVSKK